MSEPLRRCLRLMDKYFAGELSLGRLERLWRAILTEGAPVLAPASIAALNAEAREAATDYGAILAALREVL